MTELARLALSSDEKLLLLVLLVVVMIVVVLFEMRVMRKKSKEVQKIGQRKDEAYNAILTTKSVMHSLSNQGTGLTPGSSLTIPVKATWRIAVALAKHGSVKRGYLGVRTQPVEIPEAARAALQREQKSGLLVVWLEENGPAQKGGLFVGDTLVAVGGQPVSDPDDLFAALHSETVGKPIAVEVLRGGKPETVQVTVGERQ